MYSKANADGYALAIFELAKEENSVQETHKIMVALAQAIKDDNKLINTLMEGTLTREDKYNYIDSLFEEIKDAELVKKFLKVLVERNTGNLLNRILELYLKFSAEYLNLRFATLYTAHKISEATVAKMKDKLEKIYGCSIELEHVIDPELISGFKIQTGSSVIEQSYDMDLKLLQNLLLKKGD